MSCTSRFRTDSTARWHWRRSEPANIAFVKSPSRWIQKRRPKSCPRPPRHARSSPLITTSASIPLFYNCERCVRNGELGGNHPCQRLVHAGLGCLKIRITIGGCCPSEGGKLRAVADIGTHWMDTVSFIMGARITSVFSGPRDLAQNPQTASGRNRNLRQSWMLTSKYAGYRVKTGGFWQRPAEGSAMALAPILQSPRLLPGERIASGSEIYGSKPRSACWCSEQPETLCFGSRDCPNEVAFRGTPAFGPAVSRFIDYPAGHVEEVSGYFQNALSLGVARHRRQSGRTRLFASSRRRPSGRGGPCAKRS